MAKGDRCRDTRPGRSARCVSPYLGEYPPCRRQPTLESRIHRKVDVRFGGGPMQKYQPDHWQLGSGLPNTEGTSQNIGEPGAPPNRAAARAWPIDAILQQ